MALNIALFRIMTAIDTLLQNVQTFYDGLKDGTYLSEIIKENEAWICDMNTENQLFEQGINRVGVDIMDYAPYTPKTIEIKEIKGQPTNRVTLRDTGEFHASFRVITSNDSFTITADDWKTEFLMRQYGRQIIGLTDENAQELITEYIYPDLISKARETLLGA